ncbi:hypothetical protein AB5J72_07425 [Streptomyces sp. CG1]|uniref:hypothetical protein n=1 Tax=Streptomyces sp. CG1 TaxID=1287523 RepID=UPI0034E245E7
MFAGILLADSTHLISLVSLRAAALLAALAAVKSVFALGFGASGTASLVPTPAVAAAPAKAA